MNVAVSSGIHLGVRDEEVTVILLAVSLVHMEVACPIRRSEPRSTFNNWSPGYSNYFRREVKKQQRSAWKSPVLFIVGSA